MLSQEYTIGIEAKIQDKVATFLGLKLKLVRAMKSSDPVKSSKAKALYKNQLEYEVTLKDVLARIDNIKAGAFTMGDITKIGLFARVMYTHINEVNKLVGIKEAGVNGGIAASKIVPIGLLAIGAAFFLGRR